MLKPLEYTNCYVTAIPTPAVPYYWNSIRPFVELALAEAHGELDSNDVYERLCQQNMQVLVAVEEDKIIAALVTEVVQYPKKRSIRVVLAGGTGLHKWVHQAQAMLVEGARAVHADILEMHGRKGWQRALLAVGWKPTYYSMSFEMDGDDA